jgi:anti-anti-sigma regulatory factor
MGGDTVLFALSGELDDEHAARLQALLATESQGPVLLDLKEVTLVARDAVRFLARLEADGARIVNCPEYVRSWIAAENAGS